MKTNIVIITDVSLFCNIFIPLLTSKNKSIHIDICRSISEIDKKIDFSTCDLILVDGGITQTTSFEVIEFISTAKNSKTPIWFFPEIQTEKYLLKSLDLGVSRIIRKPFDPLKIVNEILLYLLKVENVPITEYT
ncbi:MAG: response regulator [Paludibacter sp.]|nr:response regulator [Paludibacter sp.]